MSKNKEKLRELEKTGNYLFHGSPFKLEKLEPRQPLSFDEKQNKMTEDGEISVVATPLIEIAIFRAIFNIKNAPERHKSFFDYNNGRLKFSASQKTFDQVKGKKGYVYVLNKKSFLKYSEMEWRSNYTVEPVSFFEVDFNDLHSEYIKGSEKEGD